MGSSDLQLEMNFAGRRENRFRQTVNGGEFYLFFETAVPGAQMPAKETVKSLQALEEAVLKISGIKCGLAIPDLNENQEAWSAVEFASHLSEENRDRHLVYLSGRGRNVSEIGRQLAIARNAGIVNIAAVSGDLDNSPERIDSGRIFQQIKKEEAFFPGVTVNPYQYDPWALTAQYAKLVSRLQQDAGFFVAQAGWDTLKLQSLSWFLLTRSLFVPGIVRLIMLTPERMRKLVENRQPGIIVGKELQRTLEKELSISRGQFEAAQLQRLGLQTAACRLMGFSGIQISGADHPEQAATIAQVVSGALREFTSFQDFLECYHSEMAESEINSFQLEFQLFDRILSRPYPFDDPPKPANLPPSRPGFWERAARLFTPGDTFSARRMGLPTARLCPKHNECGPCGGVRADGGCENGKQECVYRKWFRFAAAADALSGIEKEMM